MLKRWESGKDLAKSNRVRIRRARPVQDVSSRVCHSLHRGLYPMMQWDKQEPPPHPSLGEEEGQRRELWSVRFYCLRPIFQVPDPYWILYGGAIGFWAGP